MSRLVLNNNGGQLKTPGLQRPRYDAKLATEYVQNQNSPKSKLPTPSNLSQFNLQQEIPDLYDDPTDMEDGPQALPAEDGADIRKPKLDDIKRVFHPHSERKPVEQSFEEYRCSQVRPDRRPPIDTEPWAPFRTRLDFEVSEFAQEAMLNRNQTDTLISLLRRCAANIQAFTLNSHADMDRSWDLASKKCTEFERFDVLVPYKGVDHGFEMYARPLWDWSLDLIQDPHLADFFMWDAEKVFRYNGTEYSQLPKGPKIKTCPFIIYADKAKLSSFGTQKGYPIVARLANLVVSEDEPETGKPGYVNFKNAVWHKSFYKLLESIVGPSKTGAWVTCGDRVERCLYPIILILASDYEEANVDQSDVAQLPALRTSQQSQDIVNQARELNAEERETLLKDHGLRNVDNVFWNVAYSDPHYASSFEHLHGYASGLWGKHLFDQVKKHVERHPGRVASKIDRQFKVLPRWRNLNHFDSVMGTAFNDGSKHEDVSKQILLACHNLLTDTIDLALLKVIRSYQELNMHGTAFISACTDADFDEDKNWNFPKMHGHTHVFDDIERKGVARNFGTKIDEAMHGSARSAYLRQTNFKNVAPQILKSEHRRLICKYIWDQLNDLDQLWRREWEGSGEDESPPEDIELLGHELLGNAALGSVQSLISLGDLEQQMKDLKDSAFEKFRINLSKFLTVWLPTYGHPLPGGKAVSLGPEDKITPHRFLKVSYQSLDDWADEEDYLRCSPSFHGHPRFDGALVKTTAQDIFVKLIYVFKITLGEQPNEKTYPFALVQPLDALKGRVTAKEKALKLIRVRAKPRAAAEFISAYSIIRGAVLAPEFEREGDYNVMDVVDGDMFLRLKDHVPR
ncbi:hypothetical protein DFH09DRAFT_1110153 [Mycena vulgaris]|nr:hypothetical protein DFH09DRAFT_1110153 [Mycena vulgaris]